MRIFAFLFLIVILAVGGLVAAVMLKIVPLSLPFSLSQTAVTKEKTACELLMDSIAALRREGEGARASALLSQIGFFKCKGAKKDVAQKAKQTAVQKKDEPKEKKVAPARVAVPKGVAKGVRKGVARPQSLEDPLF